MGKQSYIKRYFYVFCSSNETFGYIGCQGKMSITMSPVLVGRNFSSVDILLTFMLCQCNVMTSLNNLSGTGARRTVTTSSLLDVILTSRPEKHISSGVIKTTFSDHYCVITVLDVSKPAAQKEKHNHRKFRDYKEFEKSAFLNDVKHSKCFASVMIESDVIKGWGNWKEEFLKICDHHALMVEKRLRNRNSPWITPQIIMMYQRDYIHRKAVDTQCDDMWQKYRELRNKIQLPAKSKINVEENKRIGERK